MKVCNKCKEEKELTEFWKKRSSKDGYQHSCISCNREYKRLNKDRFNESQRKWRVDNKERFDDYMKAWGKDYYKKNKDKMDKRNREYRESMKENVVYKIEHNGEVVRVGSTKWLNRRISEYKCNSFTKKWNISVNKFIRENIDPDNLKECFSILESGVSDENLLIREQYYIDLYKPILNVKNVII